MRTFYLLGALAALRSLRAAIPLLLERACYGDPGEMMRGIRHTLEAIVKPQWDILTDECIQAASKIVAILKAGIDPTTHNTASRHAHVYCILRTPVLGSHTLYCCRIRPDLERSYPMTYPRVLSGGLQVTPVS